MRIIIITFLICFVELTSSANAAWRFESIKENQSIIQYANDYGLNLEKHIALPDGSVLDCVLVPAGYFILGREHSLMSPAQKNEWGYILVSIGVFCLILFVIRMIFNFCRNKKFINIFNFILFISSASCGLGAYWQWVEAHEEYLIKQHIHVCDYRDFDCINDNAHLSRVYQPFYMGKFEVMQSQYQCIMKNNPSKFVGKDHPVDNVSCEKAFEFCNTLSRICNERVRLPTEIEWEWAYRANANKRTIYYSGNTKKALTSIAWYDDSFRTPEGRDVRHKGYDYDSHVTTHSSTYPVGLKQPNKWGLYDMSGNVSEWCCSIYTIWVPYQSTINYTFTPGVAYAKRGGGVFDEPYRCTAYERGSFNGPTGFRVVVELSREDIIDINKVIEN